MDASQLSQRGNTALHEAAANGQVEAVILLLDRKVKIDAKNIVSLLSHM